MKKLFLLLFIILMFFQLIDAQVSGISASKLATYNTGTVPHKKIEFEPAFNCMNSTKYFDDVGSIEPKFELQDSVFNESELHIRMTYGVLNRLELGMHFPSHLRNISIGAKYNFLYKEKIGLALLLGLNKVLNTTIPKQNRTYEESDLFAGGVAINLQFTEELSIDVDGQLQSATKNTIENHELDYFINMDIGYYVFEWIQPIIGINYRLSAYNSLDPVNRLSLDSEAFIVNPGLTIEPAEQFLMVIYTPFTIAGKNVDKSYGFGFALTITFE